MKQMKIKYIWIIQKEYKNTHIFTYFCYATKPAHWVSIPSRRAFIVALESGSYDIDFVAWRGWAKETKMR